MPVLRAPLDTSSDPYSGASRFIMLLVRLLVVAVLLVVVFADKKTDFHCCSTIFSGLCPQCFGCPFTSAPIENMERLLRERIFGQDEAIQAILTAFRAHDKKKPLTFHLAGDNGVGKSFTAKTIAEALYQYGNPSSGDFKGFLYLRGEQYQGVEQADEYRQTITRRIVEQLVECPNSLIVFDEVEYMAPQTISCISAFLDDSIPTFQYSDKIKCRTNEATFIIISDFGSEGKTDKMSFQEVKTLVERDAREFWTNPKQHSVITHIVPFMTLNATARAQTAQYQLSRIATLSVFEGRNVRNVTFAPGVVESVASFSNDAYPAHNGRGVTKYVESYVLPQIVSALDNYELNKANEKEKEEKKQEKGTQKGVVLKVAAPKGGVYHKAKFEVMIEEVIYSDKKQSWWSKWSSSNKAKTEL